uniref:Vascular cell adhesion molecule 1b n=1 Tax=Lepisosteus oculatus TaxID=7918 RepID=W5LVI7_LEPOC
MALIKFISILLIAQRGFSFNIKLQPSNPLAIVGSDLVLNCSANCLGAQFTWGSLEDKPLYAKIQNSDSQSLAILSPVKTEHENTIVCKVKCGSKSKQQSTKVNVYSFPSSPSISGNGHLLENQSTTLTCQVPDVYPAEKMEIQWLFGENVISTDYGIHSPATHTVTLIHTFKPTAGDDGKQVTCRAHLEVEGLPEDQATKETVATLQLQRAPKIIRVLSTPDSTVREGQNLTLLCEAQSDLPANLRWRKLGPGGQGPLSDSGTLSIEQAQGIHSGEYECQASNAVGTDTRTITITVQVPPKNTSITVDPSGELKEGDRVTITCSTHSTSAARLFLRKVTQNEQQLLESSDGSFTLSSARLEDTGLYECEAVNEFGSEKASVNVSVEAHPLEVQLSPPEGDLIVERGSSLVLTCQAQGCPSPDFTWKHVIDKPMDGQIEIKDHQSNLFLDTKAIEDEVTYSCKVQCGSAWKTRSIHIKIYSLPSNPVIEGNRPFQEGEEVTLTCTVHDAFPANILQLQWLEGKEVLSSEDRYYGTDTEIFTSKYTFVVRPEHNGKQIFCKAYLNLEGIPNHQKTKSALISLVVQVPPKNTSIMVDPSGELKEGDRVTITCSTHSTSAARLFLRKETQNEQQLLDLESSDGSFTLSSARLEDTGLYECEAVNEFGSEKASVKISVNAPPRNTTVSVYPSTQVLEGQNITILCKTISNPPPAIVLRKVENGTVLYSPSGTFELYNLTTNDTGLYEVNVSNDLGYETEIFIIRVEKYSAPQTPPLYNALIAAGGSIIMLTTIGLALHHLRQARMRGSYKLANANPPTV